MSYYGRKRVFAKEMKRYNDLKYDLQNTNGRWYYDNTWITKENGGRMFLLQTWNAVGRPGLIQWHKDGRIIVYKSTYFSENQKIERFIPFEYNFFRQYGKTFVKTTDETREIIDRVVFDKNGKVLNKLGKTLGQIKYQYNKDYQQTYKPRRRGNYWIQRSRNLYRDRSKCRYYQDLKNKIDKPHQARCNSSFVWRTQPPQTYGCGCRTYRKDKVKFNKTVKQILEEPNATVRTAWIQLYGLEKFFKDAEAKVFQELEGYTLYRLNTGEDIGPAGEITRERRDLMALRMVCPSTGQVYVNSVPDNVRTVPEALNWMYDVPNYLGTVGKQT